MSNNPLPRLDALPDVRGQHRGNVGEGQLHVRHDNIQDFTKYEVKPNKLEEAIRAAYDRELKAKGKSG